MFKIKIIESNPNTPDSLRLLEELSESLEAITGNSGKSSFNSEDVNVPRSLFVIAYDDGGEAQGCGGLRPINGNIAEVKRLFAKTQSLGVGTKILIYLETQARILGYSIIRLETRIMNERAVSFYENRGYSRIPNYGKYVNNPEAICFEKII